MTEGCVVTEGWSPSQTFINEIYVLVGRSRERPQSNPLRHRAWKKNICWRLIMFAPGHHLHMPSHVCSAKEASRCCIRNISLSSCIVPLAYEYACPWEAAAWISCKGLAGMQAAFGDTSALSYRGTFDEGHVTSHHVYAHSEQYIKCLQCFWMSERLKHSLAKTLSAHSNAGFAPLEKSISILPWIGRTCKKWANLCGKILSTDVKCVVGPLESSMSIISKEKSMRERWLHRSAKRISSHLKYVLAAPPHTSAACQSSPVLHE